VKRRDSTQIRDPQLKMENLDVPPPGASPAQAPEAQTHRAGIAPPHAEGDGLSGATGDRESNAFISGPAAFVGGVPLTRAMNPWAMPEAST